jgi:hypothetical protein
LSASIELLAADGKNPEHPAVARIAASLLSGDPSDDVGDGIALLRRPLCGRREYRCRRHTLRHQARAQP